MSKESGSVEVEPPIRTSSKPGTGDPLGKPTKAERKRAKAERKKEWKAASKPERKLIKSKRKREKREVKRQRYEAKIEHDRERIRAKRERIELPTGTPLMDIENASKIFGGLTAVSDVTFTIPQNAIISVIGPNGAGKTTFFNMLTGLYKPSMGRIAFLGKDVTNARPDIITTMGVARTFQNIRLFGTMTAEENVMVGQHTRMFAGVFGSILRTPRTRREEDRVRRDAREILAEVGMPRSSFDQLAINLSYGDQRRVEIARALASNPRLLLLDEPTAGMNPNESDQLIHLMRKLRDERDLSILLIEHDMKVVMGVSERVTVLDHGTKIAEGEPTAVRADPAVVEAYLGKQG